MRKERIEVPAFDEKVVKQDGLAHWGAGSTRSMLLRTAGLNSEELETCVRLAFAKQGKLGEGMADAEDEGIGEDEYFVNEFAEYG